jgi:EAL domain-containing protein (putative c-di-GMP-specific phosphodiesterase class I)
MDDFGTGYSSLSYLRSFPFDKIKIDRSFMRDLKSKGDSLAIIKAVIGLGHSLGMSTTAEGIETEEQLAAVREQGCDEVQGFLFSPPLSPQAATDMLAEEVARPRLRRVS